LLEDRGIKFGGLFGPGIEPKKRRDLLRHDEPITQNI
jgi:hypothetical protein